MFVPSLAVVWRSAMLVLGLAAAVPATGSDVPSHPNPTRGFAAAVLRAKRQIAADEIIAATGGSSILRTHAARAPRAVVLLHGFTDSPRQFAGLAESLYARGDNIFVPRLPHHAERGKNVSELARLTAAELCATADSAIDIAAGLGDSVVVVGLSVGGTMAAWAAEHRTEVIRVVVIAPPFEIAHVPSMLERFVVNFGSHVPNLTRRQAPDTTQPIATLASRRTVSPRYSVSGCGSARRGASHTDCRGAVPGQRERPHGENASSDRFGTPLEPPRSPGISVRVSGLTWASA